jgi:hypothetical protein
MTQMLTETDSLGAETIIAYAVQAIHDASLDLESEVRSTRTVESAVRLARLIQPLEQQLMRLRYLALARRERESTRRAWVRNGHTAPFLLLPNRTRRSGRRISAKEGQSGSSSGLRD